MRREQDIAVAFPGLYLVHHNRPGKKAEPHQHAAHLLFIPLQGEIEVLAESGPLVCAPGRMIYLPPKTLHAFGSSSLQGERLSCLIDVKAWRKAETPDFPASQVASSQLMKEILFYLLLHPQTRNAGSFVRALIDSLSEALETGCQAHRVA